MSFANWKPLIWSKYIQTELPKFTVFEKDCDYKYQGDVEKGKTVKISGAARPTIGNYTGASIGSPETPADTSVYLLIDQAKYFNIAVDDVDKAQAIPGIMETYINEGIRAQAETRDTYLATLMAQNYGTLSSSTSVSSKSTAKAAIDLALVTL